MITDSSLQYTHLETPNGATVMYYRLIVKSGRDALRRNDYIAAARAFGFAIARTNDAVEKMYALRMQSIALTLEELTTSAKTQQNLTWLMRIWRQNQFRNLVSSVRLVRETSGKAIELIATGVGGNRLRK